MGWIDLLCFGSHNLFFVKAIVYQNHLGQNHLGVSIRVVFWTSNFISNVDGVLSSGADNGPDSLVVVELIKPKRK